MLDKVKRYIEKYNMISEGSTIVAGVSGGADSVCMLLNLIEYSKIVSFDIVVVHINHMIRQDAMEDAEFVKRMCEQNDIPFFLYSENVADYANEHKLSTEEAGRIIRYQRFNEHLTANGRIAVAHNRNDVAETVLFNIFRGTGLEGLASITPVNGSIIRPLLGVSRLEIEEYLKKIGQSYKTDSTNATNDYARNKIRNTVIPYVNSEIVENAADHIAAMSEKMILIREYIEKAVKLKYPEIVCDSVDESSIDLQQFVALDELMKQELILAVLEKRTDGRKDIGEKHISSIIELTNKEGEKRISLPYELEAVKKYSSLIIRNKKEEKNFTEERILKAGESIELKNGERIRVDIFEYHGTMDIPRNAYTKWFDYDKIINCLKLRSRCSGDYLTINDKYDKKSLKQYMIDAKIEREKRDSQLVLADGSHIMWVIGYRISEYYKVTENTQKVVQVTFEL